MYLICEGGMIINTKHVYGYRVQLESCKDCEDFFNCSEIKPDRYIILAGIIGNEEAAQLNSYSKESYAFDALCEAITEMEITKSFYVTLKSEEEIKKPRSQAEAHPQEYNKRVVDIKLDPKKFYKNKK
jgi:hypothetical protein